MEKFNLKKRKQKGICDAIRCTHGFIIQGQYKLCQRHWDMLTNQEQKDFGEIPLSEETNTELTTPEDKANAIAAPVHEETAALVEQLDQIVIIDQDMLDQVGILLVDYQTQWKKLDTKRKEIGGPAYESYKKVNDLFKPALDALKQCKTVCKNKISDYKATQDRLREEAMNSGNHTEALAVVPTDMPPGVSTRKNWVFDIINFDDIPRKFLAVDADEVLAYMKDVGEENAEIPGLKIYQRETLSVRSK